MKLISVSGATSKAGKTSLVCNLLRTAGAGSLTAVKFATNYGKPRGCHLGSPCAVCDLMEDFRVITDARTIEMHDKDTGRFAASGARRVIWTIAREYATARAWRATEELVEDESVCVIEGSRVATITNHALRFYVVHAAIPPRLWKDSAALLLRRADVVCINTHGGVAVRDGVREAVTLLRGREDYIETDVTQPLQTWLPSEMLEQLLNLAASCS